MRALVLLCCAGAAWAQGDVARKAAQATGDLKPLCHAWEAPGWGPLQMKSFPRRAFTVGAIRVNRSRAVAALGDGVHLCLERSGNDWGCVGWRRDPAIAMEWLFAKGKPASERMPEEAADKYVAAIDNDDIAAAEALCTHDGWTSEPWSLKKIFVNTRKGKARLRRISLSQRNRRAHVLLHITQGSEARGQFYVLVIRSGGGWLLAAVTADQEVAEQFLANKPWPFRPATPAALTQAFHDAVRLHAPWRLEHLCTGPYRVMEGGLAALPAGQPGAPEIAERRATCPWGDVVLMMVKTPRGWRVDGHTADKAHAAQFLKGEVPARR